MDRHTVEHAPIPEGLPVRTVPWVGCFEGSCLKKPWDYDVTVAIPTFNGADRLPLVVALLRLQTVKPFIVIVDTGSKPDELEKVMALKAQDIEVISCAFNGVQHPSEPVSIAMDMALASLRTRFLFCTHDDCFPMTYLLLQYFRDICQYNPIVGHQITPRPCDDWEGMTGHTALMLDGDYLLDHGITWSMRRTMRLFGVEGGMINTDRQSWPDTEIGLNYLFQQIGVKPCFTGTEKNWSRNRDGLIDHCRSSGGGKIYDKEYWQNCAQQWLKDAMREGWKRVKEWSALNLPEALPCPKKKCKGKKKLPTFTKGRV